MMKYGKTDFIRAFTSKEFVISIFGILLLLFMGCLSDGVQGNSVVRLVWYSTFGVQFLVVMVVGAAPYAGSVCEDLEYGYIHQILIRENLRNYCISRAITVLLSSIGSFTIGMMSFAAILKCRLPWIDTRDSVYQAAVRSGSFRQLLLGEYFYLYVLLFSIQLGMMIGILSLFSACISLFISNKLLVMSIPVMAYYFISQYAVEIFPDYNYFNLDLIFGGKKNIFDNDVMSFAYAILVMCLIGTALTCLLYFRLQRRVNGEQ